MNLLSKLSLNESLHLKNRVIMAPMTRSRIDNKEMVPGDLQALYYAQRASAGLLISEGTAVSKEAVGYLRIPGIFTEQQIEGWRKVTSAVHKKGGLIYCQLWHVGRITHPDLIGGEIPMSASAINHQGRIKTYNGIVDSVTPREMTVQDIIMVKNQFVKAAKNSIEAGFDGVEIHSSNGYIFHQFFSTSSNNRFDNYGGSPKNRTRFFFQVLEAVGNAIGYEKVAVRFNPMMHNSIGISVDELTLPVFDYLIEKLNNYPISFLHLTRAVENLNVPYCENDVIGRYRKIYKGTLVANGAYSPEEADDEIKSGRADAIAFGKLYISNPDLVEKIENLSPLNPWEHATFYTEGEKGYTELD